MARTGVGKKPGLETQEESEGKLERGNMVVGLRFTIFHPMFILANTASF